MAARWGNPAVITALLKAGADPNAVDNEGNTPLGLARTRDIPAAIKALEEAINPADAAPPPTAEPDTASIPSM